MKLIKYLFIGIIAVSITSCVDDGTIGDDISATPNLIGFTDRSAPTSAVASPDSAELTKTVRVNIVGPNLDAITGPVTATVAVNEATTAIEGVHYRLDATSFTIGPDDNFFGEFSFTMLTRGLFPPLASTPNLVLDVVAATGDGSVVAKGTSVTIPLLYLCFADLNGTYLVTNDFCGAGNPNGNLPYTVQISQNPSGSWYLTVADGAFLNGCTGNVTLENWGSINELCGSVLPTADLRYGGLGIGVISGGTWDQAAGILTMQHDDSFFNGGPYAWESTYTRQ